MNDKKKQLIIELRKDGRKKLTDISSTTGIAVSTLFDIIHRFEEKKVIEHKTHVNFPSVGFPIHLMIALKTSLAQRQKLQEFLKIQRNVNSVYNINSGFDFMIEAVFRNQKEAQDFLDVMETENKIHEKNVFNIIETVQREKFLSEERHFA